jgi:hypothetical protein
VRRPFDGRVRPFAAPATAERRQPSHPQPSQQPPSQEQQSQQSQLHDEQSQQLAQGLLRG